MLFYYILEHLHYFLKRNLFAQFHVLQTVQRDFIFKEFVLLMLGVLLLILVKQFLIVLSNFINSINSISVIFK